jgi:putative Mg2+ transporter-C (MgtC) family protein
MDWNIQFWVLLDIFVAAILGGIVGMEREWKQKPAGLRTNMIIAAASAFFISLGRFVIVDFKKLLPDDDFFGADPIRIVYATILGVSVLGAGTILKKADGSNIKYLTTSATILMASAIGMSVALKQYMVACGATLIILIINRFFSYIGKAIADKREGKS